METLQPVRLLIRDSHARAIIRGIVPKNVLLALQIDAYPVAFVCNTHDLGKPGEHWIALYVDANARGEYFCSYGLPPRQFLDKHCVTWTHNSKKLQSPVSNVCGQYCVADLMFHCRGLPMKEFVNGFGTDLVTNDCRVFDWLKQLH